MISLAPLLAAIGCWVDPAGERVDEARLLTDFQVAAARFHEATSRLRVERSIIKQKRENDLHAVFLVDKDCESLQQFHTTERGDYGERVMVACGAGRFLVRKKSPVSSYLLAKKDAGEDSSRSLLKERLEVIDVPYVIGGWLSYRTDMPPASFRFTRAIRKGEAVEASPVIEADFELKWIRTGLTTEGSVKLDPSRQLAVLSSEYVARPIKPGQPTVSKSVEIQYTPDLGSIVPAKITWRSNKDKTGKYRLRSVYEITKWESGPISPEMFTLAHYGLGDVERPVTMTPKRRTTPYWLLGTAVAGIIALGLTRWFTRRRAAPQTAP